MPSPTPQDAEEVPVKQPEVPPCDLYAMAYWHASNKLWYGEVFYPTFTQETAMKRTAERPGALLFRLRCHGAESIQANELERDYREKCERTNRAVRIAEDEATADGIERSAAYIAENGVNETLLQERHAVRRLIDRLRSSARSERENTADWNAAIEAAAKLFEDSTGTMHKSTVMQLIRSLSRPAAPVATHNQPQVSDNGGSGEQVSHKPSREEVREAISEEIRSFKATDLDEPTRELADKLLSYLERIGVKW